MQKDFVSPVKSIGHGITCTADLDNEEEVLHVLLELSQDVGHACACMGWQLPAFRFLCETRAFYSTQYQYKLPFKTQLPSEIAAAGFQLFKEHYIWTEKVRAITIRAIDLIPQTTEEQLSLMVDYERRDRRVRLEDAIEDLRRRFGKKISNVCWPAWQSEDAG